MSSTQQGGSKGREVTFSYFCSFVHEVAKVQPSTPESRRRSRQSSNKHEYPTLRIFHNWIKGLHDKFSPIPPGTTAICFRLLFPEEDVHRKYEIQEASMASLLQDCFGIEKKKFDRRALEQSSGCLGQELRNVLEKTCPNSEGFISPISIAEIDLLLDELAANSKYTHQSIRDKHPNKRKRADVIRSLFRQLSPLDAAVLTQIILKDLRPLLYPMSEWHYSTALTKFNTASVKMLTKEHAINAWDPSKSMLKFYRVRCDINAAAVFVDLPAHQRHNVCPKIGSMIAIPKSEKGLSCEHALHFFNESGTLWAETKYDGERAQIHVEVIAGREPLITIFSKSKRDSTQDRHAIHEVIRVALGLDRKHRTGPKIKREIRKNIILDAEMVPFRGTRIEEFWRIRKLIERTAHGIRGRRTSSTFHKYVGAASHNVLRLCSLRGEVSDSDSDEDDSELRLGLVFFDVLYLDGESLIYKPYKYRRDILESVIHTEPGKIRLAKRFPIDMSSQAESQLRHVFCAAIAKHEEGLVLKAEYSLYNDFSSPWVKLKKDYIPDCGDSVDLLILGASWEKVRGRTLRVPPSTFTTFYIGVLDQERKASLPCFRVYFTVSYGLNRTELEQLNFEIKTAQSVRYHRISMDLPYELSVFRGIREPEIVLKTPLVANLMGAGYTKASGSKDYELRFPRLARVYRASERHWKTAIDRQALNVLARTSVGRELSGKECRDCITYRELYRETKGNG
ncbi:DNA ligase/mRNA capping enzyme [Agrocybe pediades]|nr:DNA ligase/mRNA capping enzyme [Agrocybe pediades]